MIDGLRHASRSPRARSRSRLTDSGAGCATAPAGARRVLPAVALALWAVTGCVSTPDWFAPDVDRWAAKVSQLEKQEHPLVVLRHDHEVVYRYTQNSYTEETQHLSLMAVTEAGIDSMASFALASRDGAELKAFGARAIQPSGEVVELDGVTTYEEETTVEGETIKRTFFRIPGVTVGSTVEFFTVYRYDGLPSIYKRTVSSRVPVLEYRLTLDVGPDLGYQFRSYNTDQVGRVEKKATGGVLIRFRLDDIPAQRNEDWATDGSLTEPWWLLAIVSYGTYPSSASSWTQALRWQTKRLLVDDEFLDDPDLEIDVDACQSGRCRVERAWTFVREHTEFDHFSEWYRARPLSEVLGSGYASNHEKAYLLYAALEEVGFSPRLAVVNRPLSRGYDFELPTTSWFNHHVVVLDDEGLGDGGLVLDPSCEHCGLDALPDWSAGRKALIYTRDVRSAVRGEITTNAEWVTLPSSSTGSNRETLRYKLKVNPRWGLDLHVERKWFNSAASNMCTTNRDLDAVDKKQRLERDARSRFGRGVDLEAFTLRTCDRAQGTAVEAYEGTTTPGMGTIVTGDRLVVPLGFLGTQHDGDLVRSVRQQDIVVRHDSVMEEVVSLTVPDGFQLTEAPAAAVDGEAFSFELSTRASPTGAVISRKLTLHAGRYPKAAYEALRAPLRAYDLATRELVVFERQR